ncbi:MAG TPA: sugar ABC transporter permease [Acidimicrobiales bacterium]|jgi:multiple sugar transport system permease protein|nr:sugar ABC transporter permease [Acidimicrobiales bacterium]
MSGPALSERARSERRLGWLLCTPAVIAMVAVTAYPIGYAVWLSLQRADLRFPNDNAFIGLRNYTDVLASKVWWADLSTTLTITVVSLAIELVIGMAVALVLHRAVFVRRTVRTSVLIPYGIITVVASLAWKYAFTPGTGFVNPLLGVNSDLLGSRLPSMVVIIMTEVWKTTPFMALLLLAGLALVPDELHDAARVDGAGPVQRFFLVTLPLMKPAILVAMLFRALDAFRIFDSVFILTRGANDTESVSILGYNQLINRLNLGIGSAVSVLIFVCVLVIAVIFVKGFGTSLIGQGDR